MRFKRYTWAATPSPPSPPVVCTWRKCDKIVHVTVSDLQVRSHSRETCTVSALLEMIPVVGEKEDFVRCCGRDVWWKWRSCDGNASQTSWQIVIWLCHGSIGFLIDGLILRWSVWTHHPWKSSNFWLVSKWIIQLPAPRCPPLLPAIAVSSSAIILVYSYKSSLNKMHWYCIRRLIIEGSCQGWGRCFSSTLL